MNLQCSTFYKHSMVSVFKVSRLEKILREETAVFSRMKDEMTSSKLCQKFTERA